MGLSSLTRYNLFMESGDLIESGEGIVRFRDYLSVKNMYYDSARLLRGFGDGTVIIYSIPHPINI